MKKLMLLPVIPMLIWGLQSSVSALRDSSESLDTNNVIAQNAYSSHGEYDKLKFKGTPIQLNFNYPRNKEVIPGFKSKIKGQIYIDNAEEYVQELVDYSSGFINRYIKQKGRVDFVNEKWFQEPWMGKKREPVIGAYNGNPNNAGTFEGVNHNQGGFVFVAYDELAATVPGKAFSEKGVLNESYSARFPEGSVIVKFAFSELTGDRWPDMIGAPKFEMMIPRKNSKIFDSLITVSLFQIDIVVRDTEKSPQTGWVFSTLVYDKAKKINSDNPLSQFVALGAMWGNDPENELFVDKSVNIQNPKLKESWINNSAPKYSRETLGVAGRLSGPNDGAVKVTTEYYSDVNNTLIKTSRVPMTSCMSCHMPAQNNFKSFLLPMDRKTEAIYNPASKEFKKYFRNLIDQPFDDGQKTYDYNMALAFKSIPAYKSFMNDLNNKKDSPRWDLINRESEIVEQFEQFRIRN